MLATEKLNYTVTIGKDAKSIAESYLADNSIPSHLGLAESSDRYHEWKIPVLSRRGEHIGDIYIDAYDSKINLTRSTNPDLMRSRLDSLIESDAEPCKTTRDRSGYPISPLSDQLICGDSLVELDRLPENSIDLVFTSPPYYNARPQYKEYQDYDEYLSFIKNCITKVARVLVDGRFFVMNISHVLVPRNSRSESSQRIAVPFDFHQLFMGCGFEFIDDIIWQKPEGAGWVSGRGRRFSADRNPLQYKAVPVTEYVLVYRKKSDRLIDWFIRNHPDRDVIESSKIADDYEKTNIWYISPSRSKAHPATFPVELAKKVISYYSFKNDVVLDPFGGIGTVGTAAMDLGRRFVIIEKMQEYVSYFLEIEKERLAARNITPVIQGSKIA